MEKQEQIMLLDLYLAQHKGLLSTEEEKRYIDLLIKEKENTTLAGTDGEEPQEEPVSLELLKLNKRLQLLVHDSSDAVNSFTIGGQKMWLTPDQRANYLLTIAAAQEAGVESVPFAGTTLPVANALAALKAINLYAMQCVAVTEEHAKKIAAKKTVATVEAYDFTGGYPEKLSF